MIAWDIGTWGFVLSVVAVVLSGASVVYTRRQANTDRDRRESEKAARVRAVVRDERSLAIVNDGPAYAYNVTAESTGGATPGMDIPYDEIVLAPTKAVHIDLIPMKNTTRPMKFRISWRDDRGSQHIDVEE